ncbi:MAG: LCP family protein, partial [Candidatus Peregrinibacteria bacterium]|nr:LCP family protein [Candidatus Peregrinibacteria bacterium]
MNKKRFKKLLDKWNKRQPQIVLLLGILMIFQLFSNAQMALTIREVANNNSQVIDEMGQVVEAVNSFGGDLNEIRQFLLLPTKDYSTTLISEEEAEEVATEVDPVVQIFEAIEKIGADEENRTHYEQVFNDLDAYMNASETLSLFSGYGLYLRNGVSYHLADDEGTIFVTVSLDSSGDITMTTFSDETYEYGEDSTFEEFKLDIEDILANQLQGMKDLVALSRETRSRVYDLLNLNETLQAALAEHSLSVGTEREVDDEEGDGYYAYDLQSADGIVLLTIEVAKSDGTITIEEEVFEVGVEASSDEDFVNWVIGFVGELDGRGHLEKTIEELAAAIESLREDEGFQSTLDKYTMTFTFDPVETDTALEYFILNSDGDPVMILYISKETGELMLKEPDAETGSLLSAVLSTEMNAIDLPSSVVVQSEVIETADEINILIAGKHGGNVDTMIFTNVDTINQKVTMISIPRDLYYNSRKINSVYYSYGMDELTRELSDITGRRIDKYILVDMYVFIDLVDLVGGIDVILEEDLVDPTYKTYDNGVAGTLYYPAGEHHFTGVQALRIARSRHTTSDYSRAARQQLIIEGLQIKAQNLGFGDATTVIELMETVLGSTETNIAIEEAMTYYFRYQNFEINRGNVLSSGNVLASLKIPVNYLTSLRIDTCSEAAIAEGCEIQYALYALGPR